ncbi:hypothetical protein NA56DRAFT_566706, partial [Hyaloscypha hepaticicola]
LVDVPTLSTALCSNTTRLSNISICVQKSCDWPDQVNTSHVESTLCTGFPRESRRNGLMILVIVLSGVTFPVVGLKLFTRWTTGHRLWADDYTSLAATILLAALAGLDIAGASLGLGNHYWNVNPAHYTRLFKLFYVSQILYVAIQVFAKTSLLLLYLRVFTKRWFTITCNLGIVFLALHGIAYLLAVSFQCTPADALWNPEEQGKCMSLTTIGVSGAFFSIFEDVIILLLPIPEIINLQMSTTKKWALCLLFGIGSFACVTSGIRLKYFVKFAEKSFDPTWDWIDVIRWSTIEEFTAVLCTALPSMRAVFRQAFGFLSDALGTFTGSLSARQDNSQNLVGKAGSVQSLTTNPKHRDSSSMDSGPGLEIRKTIETTVTTRPKGESHSLETW